MNKRKKDEISFKKKKNVQEDKKMKKNESSHTRTAFGYPPQGA